MQLFPEAKVAQAKDLGFPQQFPNGILNFGSLCKGSRLGTGTIQFLFRLETGAKSHIWFSDIDQEFCQRSYHQSGTIDAWRGSGHYR